MTTTRASRTVRFGTCVLLTAGLSLVPGTAMAEVPAPAAPPDQELQVVDLSNQARAAAGCGPLVLDPSVDVAAEVHSAEMAASQTLGHVGPSGTPRDRIAAQGLRPGRTAENVATGYPDARGVVGAWLSSPGHRASLLDCSLTRIGVAVVPGAGGASWWTQSLTS